MFRKGSDADLFYATPGFRKENSGLHEASLTLYVGL